MFKQLSKSIMPAEFQRSARIGYKVLQASFHDFKAAPPVIIYAMPKSGTSTIEATLKHAGIPVYKAHRLSEQGLTLAEAKIQKYQNVRFFNIQKISRVLQQKIAKSPDIPWKIITLAREPIAQVISALFQGIEYFQADLIDAEGNIKIQPTIEYLQQRFSEYTHTPDEKKLNWYNINWFEHELKVVFNIDVYQYPYEFERGFTIINQGLVEVLVIRMKDLDHHFSRSAQQLLGLNSPLDIKRENIGRNKRFYTAYKTIQQKIILPEDVCKAIYSSRYAQHFYTQAERDLLIQKWSNCPLATIQDR